MFFVYLYILHPNGNIAGDNVRLNVRNIAANATCWSSSYYNDDNQCQNSINGDQGDKWTSFVEDTNGWIYLEFDRNYQVYEVAVWSSTLRTSQCHKLSMETSGGLQLSVSTTEIEVVIRQEEMNCHLSS